MRALPPSSSRRCRSAHAGSSSTAGKESLPCTFRRVRCRSTFRPAKLMPPLKLKAIESNPLSLLFLPPPSSFLSSRLDVALHYTGRTSLPFARLVAHPSLSRLPSPIFLRSFTRALAAFRVDSSPLPYSTAGQSSNNTSGGPLPPHHVPATFPFPLPLRPSLNMPSSTSTSLARFASLVVLLQLFVTVLGHIEVVYPPRKATAFAGAWWERDRDPSPPANVQC